MANLLLPQVNQQTSSLDYTTLQKGIRAQHTFVSGVTNDTQYVIMAPDATLPAVVEHIKDERQQLYAFRSEVAAVFLKNAVCLSYHHPCDFGVAVSELMYIKLMIGCSSLGSLQKTY